MEGSQIALNVIPWFIILNADFIQSYTNLLEEVCCGRTEVEEFENIKRKLVPGFSLAAGSASLIKLSSGRVCGESKLGQVLDLLTGYLLTFFLGLEGV